MRYNTNHEETANEHKLTVELPGYKKSTAELRVVVTSETEIVFKLKAAKTEDATEKDSFALLYRVAHQSVNLDDAKATLEDGVLTLTIPKREGYKPRTITIE